MGGFFDQVAIAGASAGLAGVRWAQVGFAALVGAAVGSFVGVVAVRLPQGRSVLGGRSACDACGAGLAPHDLVPVVSWLALRGRCRHCRGAIGLDPLLAEIGGAAVGAAGWMLAPQGSRVAAVVLGWQLLALALLDWRHLWLPPRLLAVLALSGFCTRLALSLVVRDITPVLAGLGGAVVGWALLATAAFGYRCWRGRDGLGEADPWLLGALGVWLGAGALPLVVLGAAGLGLAMALGQRLAGHGLSATTLLPLGTWLALAGWVVFLRNGLG